MCVQQGWSPEEVYQLDSTFRKSVMYAVAMQNGFDIDFDTGVVHEKKK